MMSNKDGDDMEEMNEIEEKMALPQMNVAKRQNAPVMPLKLNMNPSQQSSTFKQPTMNLMCGTGNHINSPQKEFTFQENYKIQELKKLQKKISS